MSAGPKSPIQSQVARAPIFSQANLLPPPTRHLQKRHKLLLSSFRMDALLKRSDEGSFVNLVLAQKPFTQADVSRMLSSIFCSLSLLSMGESRLSCKQVAEACRTSCLSLCLSATKSPHAKALVQGEGAANTRVLVAEPVQSILAEGRFHLVHDILGRGQEQARVRWLQSNNLNTPKQSLISMMPAATTWL